MPKQSKLMLVDGNALIHRAYHALPPLTAPSGEPTNATFGFTSMLLRALDDHKPTHVVVAFDTGRTFRHERYADYKANRAKMDDELAVQFESVRRVLDALGIARCGAAGYEADDLLGTLAQQAHERGMETLIVTGDTDALQLVRPDVKVVTPGRRFSDTVVYDVQAVEQRYGLRPEQLVDYKALVGDTSDNIPGVRGVGPKTATQLLQEFGSLDGIYEHLDEVRGARARAALEGSREQAHEARMLVTIVTDAPVELDEEAARFGRYERDEALQVFWELDFRSLIGRLPAPDGNVVMGQNGAQLALFAMEGEPAVVRAPGEYEVIRSEEELAALATHLAKAPALAIDVETTDIDAMRARLVGIALSGATGKGYYVPVGHEPGVEDGPQLSIEAALDILRPLLLDERLLKVAHNAKYDLTVLAEHGAEVRGLAWDTMLAAWLVNPSSRNLGLKGLAWEKLDLEMTPIEALIGKGKGKVTMAQVPVQRVAPYASADVDVTLRLRDLLERELAEREQEKLFHEIEVPLVPVLVDMERRGVALDVLALTAMSHELAERLADLEAGIHRVGGGPFNVNSPRQLGQVLFDKLGLRPVHKTQTGSNSTNAAALEALRGKHEIIDLILEYRQLAKLKSTYVDALPQLVNGRTGRVHTSFNQTAVVTGRLSSSDPNLQNIPIRTELGSQIRRAFVAPAGWQLLGADYSQVELRILAHVCGDEAMLGAFARGEDIHARTAAMIYGVPLEDVTPKMRYLAKTINFGLIYGMSGYGLAQRTELSQGEADRFVESYFAQFPAVRAYLDETKRQAREEGYVETLFGRRRYFPELTADSRVPANMRRAAERMAINMPIQGTAADIIKIAMIRLHRTLREQKLRAAMILQVHDELVLEVPDEELEQVRELVRSVMEGAYALRAPLRVDMAVGNNWLEME